MSDNVTFQTTVATPPTGTVVSTEEVTTLNGGAVTAQQVQRVAIASRTADGVAVDLIGDTSNGLDTDVTRVVPGTGATNLGKAEGAAHTSGDVGVMALGVRQDATAPLGADGAYTPYQLDANGLLKVNVLAGGGTGGTSLTDDAAFTPAVSAVNPIGAFFDDVAPDSVNEGDIGAVRMSANRNLYTTLRDAAGNERGVNVTAGNALTVDGSAVTQPVSAASLPLPTGASTAARQDTGNTALAAIQTAVEIIDDWDESDRAKVNPIVGQAGVAAGAGAVGVTTQRTTLASDDPAVVALQIIDDWDESDRAKVNVIVGQAGITAGAGAVAANTPRVTHASDDPVTTAVQLIDDVILTDDTAFTPATSKVAMVGFEADETATDSVDEGDGGAARMTLDRKVITTPQPHTTGGLTPHKAISAASTNATGLKASAGQVYGIQVFNLNAAARYLKLYNKASAPTVGTDTPVKVIMIPGNTAGAGAVSNWAYGVTFDTGIAYALTTGIADSDTGAVAANEIVVNIDYK